MAAVNAMGVMDETSLDALDGVVNGTAAKDTMTWAAYTNLDNTPMQLNGGAGMDTLTLQVTQAQLDAFLKELNTIKGAGGDPVHVNDQGQLVGQGAMFNDGKEAHFLNSLGLDINGWEKIMIEVKQPHLVQKAVLDFESDNVDGGNGYHDAQLGTLFTQVVPTDWTSANGPVEIQGGASGYGGHTNYGAFEDQYLDTAQSAGNINITSANGNVDVTAGAKAHIDISVAPQDLIYPGNGQHYATDLNATFDLVFNSQTVHTFTMAEFGNITANNQDFQTFSFDKDVNGNDLVGVAGTDHISIVAHGQQDAYTGYSVDHVVLSEWTF